MMMTMMSAKGYDVSSRDIYGKTTATLPASCPPCALHIVHIHGRSALFPLHCAHTWTITNCTITHICVKVFCTPCKSLSNVYFVHCGKEVQCGECGAGLGSHDNMDWGPHVSWSWHWWWLSSSWSSSQFWPYHEKFITMILASKKKLLHNCTSSTNPAPFFNCLIQNGDLGGEVELRNLPLIFASLLLQLQWSSGQNGKFLNCPPTSRWKWDIRRGD